MINHKFKILGFTCKCVEIKKCMKNYFKETEPFTPPPGMRHFRLITRECVNFDTSNIYIYIYSLFCL